MDTDGSIRLALAPFIEAELPPELTVAEWLQDELRKTDGNLGDRDAMLAMLLMAVVRLEVELRKPPSREFVLRLTHGGDGRGVAGGDTTG